MRPTKRGKSPLGDQNALAVASAIAGVLVAEGARAIVLIGSHARGDATKHSDIDLVVIGQGPQYRLERQGDHLIATSWRTFQECLDSLHDPGEVGALIPAWRSAVVLHDPEGMATALQHEANKWDWAHLEDVADRWVAEHFTGYAEEVHKLVAAMEAGDNWGAAVQRSVLALRLASVLSVQHRIFYETENHLWSLVGEAMGEPWSKLQAAAFALHGESLAESCAAALQLFIIAAEEIWPLLDKRQVEVVSHAISISNVHAISMSQS